MTTMDSILAALDVVSKLGIGLTPQVMLAKQLVSHGTEDASPKKSVLYYPLIYFGGEQPVEHQRVVIAKEISALEKRARGLVLSCVGKFSSYLAGRGQFSDFLQSFIDLAFLLQAKRGFIDKIPPYYELSTNDINELRCAFEPEAARKKVLDAIEKILDERRAVLEVVTPLSKMVTVIVECLLEEHSDPDEANPFVYQPQGEGVAGFILDQQVGVCGKMDSFSRFKYRTFLGNDPKYKLLSLLDNFMGVGGVSANYFFGYPFLHQNANTLRETQGVLYFTGSQDNMEGQAPVASLLAVFGFIEALDEENHLAHGPNGNGCVCNENETEWKRAVKGLFAEPDNAQVSKYIDTLAGFSSENAKRIICSRVRRRKTLSTEQANARFAWQENRKENWLQTAKWNI